MLIASSWSDVLFLLVAAAVVFGATALAVRLFGRSLSKRNRALAVVICASAVPVLMALLLATAPQGPPPNDGPAMLFIALMTLALLSFLVSVPASVLLIRKAK